MRLPSATAVTTCLRNIRALIRSHDDVPTCDVRLQVYQDGDWSVRWGDSQYDLDHRGYWGCSSISPGDADSDLVEVAQYLLRQVEDDMATDPNCARLTTEQT